MNDSNEVWASIILAMDGCKFSYPENKFTATNAGQI